MARIVWTRNASNDFHELFDYISKDSKFYAIRFSKKIIYKIELLLKFPMTGRIVPEFDNANIRELLEGNYRIVYRVENKNIYLLRISHTSRQLKNL
ncbi:MAG: type II toxin-antitoxin system RelE/ParE family toxin [Flavobacterium sp.]|nr:type II toxin-antitoxin system RelE/ParE family toxin [Flavobacterium sp.]